MPWAALPLSPGHAALWKPEYLESLALLISCQAFDAGSGAGFPGAQIQP
jgi:hypothetical protein